MKIRRAPNFPSWKLEMRKICVSGSGLSSSACVNIKRPMPCSASNLTAITGKAFYTDKMPAQVERLRARGLLKIDDGASVVDLEPYGMPPCLILKRDGSTLYPTRDIAAAVYRKETYDFDKCIYVTSAGQSLHFAQWFKVVELMGYDWYDRLVHVPYGTVSIGGEKLATRTGNVVLLKDLFAQAIEKSRAIVEEKNPGLENKDEVAEAVGVGAVVFHYLSNSRIKDISFVIEDALSFEGNTGPFMRSIPTRAPAASCAAQTKCRRAACGSPRPRKDNSPLCFPSSRSA